MKHLTIFLLLVLCQISISFSQSMKYSIFLEEYDYTFTPKKENCQDTLLLNDKIEERTFKITLYDCKGKMHIQCFKGGVKREEGEYLNPFDLLRRYVTRVNGITGNQNIKVYEYYQPLRTGTWFFYDKRGRLLKKIKYTNGVLSQKYSNI